jgi:hypothetical protein
MVEKREGGEVELVGEWLARVSEGEQREMVKEEEES